MALLDDFLRVSRSRLCPVCRKPDWCLVSKGDPRNPREAICSRIASDRPCGAAGWLHILDSSAFVEAAKQHTAAERPLQEPPAIDFPAIAEQFRQAMTDAKASYLAESLGVSEDSLRRLHVGWASGDSLRRVGTNCRDLGAWAFPMFDAQRNAIGVRLRSESGFKFSVVGSKQGVFYPCETPCGTTLLLPEGPTDTAALMDLGFSAIGRPNCLVGGKILGKVIRNLKPRLVVVVADGDDAGERGANKLAEEIAGLAQATKIISAPHGVKDARQWLSVGADFTDIQELISKAQLVAGASAMADF